MSRTQLLVPWAPFWGLLGLDIGTGARKHQLGSDHRPVTGLGLCGLCQQPGQGLGPLDTNSRPAFSDNWSLAHSGPGLASGPKTWRPLSRAVGHSVSWPPEALVLIFPPEWVGVVTLSLVLRMAERRARVEGESTGPGLRGWGWGGMGKRGAALAVPLLADPLWPLPPASQ